MNDKDENELSGGFKRLYGLFKVLNTHLTFLASHSRTTIPTFETIQKFLPDITQLDLAVITHILPQGDISYRYVDENQVLLSFAEKVEYSWNHGYKLTKVSESTYEPETVSKQLLIFDFRDTKLHGIGSKVKGAKVKRRKVEKDKPETGFFLSTADLSLQNLLSDQLLNIITSRNSKFIRHMKPYTDKDYKELENQCTGLIPIPPQLNDPVEELELKPVIPADHLTRPLIQSMVSALKLADFYKKQVEAIETLTASRPAATLPLNETIELHPELVFALKTVKNIDVEKDLYSHQSEALESILAGKNHTIVSTSTSSGKSLIYQVPIVNEILWDLEENQNPYKRRSTAFFIFPTKALAQDQLRHLQTLISALPSNSKRQIIIDTYDGDTPAESRSRIRRFADIIFTNPDTIHASILPNHSGYSYLDSSDGWQDFLLNLKFVVVDELHVYKGTFGVNIRYVMSRLQRIHAKITEHLSKDIIFVSCSATVLNPPSHFRAVCGIHSSQHVTHIHQDGSPCAEKKLVVWNPPPLMNKRGQTQSQLQSSSEVSITNRFIPRVSLVEELARLLLHLLSQLPTIKVILFCPIRAVCELMMKEVRSLLLQQKWPNVQSSDIMSYRGGYSKSDRRLIEQKMFSGQLRAIVATNALELGIDLADLDIVITCGFSGSKLNLHQQFGRAGRGRDSNGSLAIYVAGSSPVDQYYLKNYKELCDKSDYEDLCVEGLIEIGQAQLILELHLQCAAFEWPIDLEHDMKWFTFKDSAKQQNQYVELCRTKLVTDNLGRYRTSPTYLPWPVDHCSIRHIDDNVYAVVDITNGRNVVIEEVEELRTSFTLYEGGIFLHQGVSYLVKEFNTEEKYAKVQRVEVDWTTSQRDYSDVDPIEIEVVKCLRSSLNFINDIPVFYGKILTTIKVFGYFKLSRKAEILEAVDVANPPVFLKSKGFWIDIPEKALLLIQDLKLSPAGGVHAAQHAIMNILPLFISGGATTNPNARFLSNVGEAELRTECKAPEKEFARRETSRKRPARLVFHDAKGGERGSGVSAKTFEHIDEIIFTTYKRVKECECEWGCPLCVTASFCSENMLVMSKPAAIIILADLLGLPLDKIKEEVPHGPEPNMPRQSIETVLPVREAIKFSKDVEIIASRPISDSERVVVKTEEESD